MKVFSVRFPDEVAEAVLAVAAQERRSANQQIVKALEEWLAARQAK